jgi:hypothetical protein
MLQLFFLLFFHVQFFKIFPFAFFNHSTESDPVPEKPRQREREQERLTLELGNLLLKKISHVLIEGIQLGRIVETDDGHPILLSAGILHPLDLDRAIYFPAGHTKQKKKKKKKKGK